MDLEDIPHVLNLISALILIIILNNARSNITWGLSVLQALQHCTHAVSNVYYTITFHIQSIMHSVYAMHAGTGVMCIVYCLHCTNML